MLKPTPTMAALAPFTRRHRRVSRRISRGCHRRSPITGCSNTLGNALGNSIVGQIETTGGEQEQARQPLSGDSGTLHYTGPSVGAGERAQLQQAGGSFSQASAQLADFEASDAQGSGLTTFAYNESTLSGTPTPVASTDTAVADAQVQALNSEQSASTNGGSVFTDNNYRVADSGQIMSDAGGGFVPQINPDGLGLVLGPETAAGSWVSPATNVLGSNDTPASTGQLAGDIPDAVPQALPQLSALPEPLPEPVMSYAGATTQPTGTFTFQSPGDAVVEQLLNASYQDVAAGMGSTEGSRAERLDQSLLSIASDSVDKTLDAFGTVVSERPAEILDEASKVFHVLASTFDISERVGRVEALPPSQMFQGAIGEVVDFAATDEIGATSGVLAGFGVLGLAAVTVPELVFAAPFVAGAAAVGAAYAFGKYVGPEVRNLTLPNVPPKE